MLRKIIDLFSSRRQKYIDLKGFKYKKTRKDIVITGLKDQSLTDIVIPDGVTVIGYSAFNRSHITSVVIPSSVKKLLIMHLHIALH